MSRTATDFAAARDQFERHETLSATSGTLRLASAAASSFEVTTLDDVVDASDGVLSLREAITLANDRPGADTITFADSIRGGTIHLDDDLPDITDALTIDGDPDDGGPGGIVIDGRLEVSLGNYHDHVRHAFKVKGTSLKIEDITLDRAGHSIIEASDSEIDVSRALIQKAGRDAPYTDTETIRLAGGSLRLEGSTVQDGWGPAVRFDDASVQVVDSTIAGNGFEYTAGVWGYGDLEVVSSTFIRNLSGHIGAIRVDGTVDIADSAFIGNGIMFDAPLPGLYGASVAGIIVVTGDLRLVNSTIARSVAAEDPGDKGVGAVVLPAGGSTAEIVNTTITGSEDYFEGQPAVGLYVGAGSQARIANSIIDDTVVIGGSESDRGLILSNGASTFRDAAVEGAVAGDRLGVTADELFAVTEKFGGGVLRGVPLDNGGGAWTVALRDSADNPAIDAADPADAPPADQRGFARDAAPDIGAFEAGAESGLVPGVPVSSDKTVDTAGMFLSDGLRGEFYDLGDHIYRIESLIQADDIIAGNAPDAVFTATRIDFPVGTDDIESSVDLATYLGEAGESIVPRSAAGEVAGPSVWRFSGLIRIDETMDLIEGNDTIDVRFDLNAWHGARLSIGGQEIANNDGSGGFSPGDSTMASFESAGLYDIEVVHYATGGSLGIELTTSIPDPGAGAAPGFPPSVLFHTDVLPELAEHIPLAPALVNGVDPRVLEIGPAGDATITFLGENGAHANSLGAYLIDGDDHILDATILWENMQADGPSPAITPGESIALSDVFDPGDLAEGTRFGLFLVSDGANGNLPDLLGDGQLAFLDGASTATTGDTKPTLVHIADNGLLTPVEGEVMHVIGDKAPIGLNANGRAHAVSGWSDGQFVVAFEDKHLPTSHPDVEPDFNDVLIAISPAGPAATVESVAALSAGIIDGPEQADFDAALESLSANAVTASSNEPANTNDGPGGMSAPAGGAADTELLVVAGDLAA